MRTASGGSEESGQVEGSQEDFLEEEDVEPRGLNSAQGRLLM